MSTLSVPGNFHAVRFYKDSQSLCGLVSGFLAEGLATGHPAVAVAIAGHRHGIVEQLRWRGVDPDALQASGDLLLLDAHDTLAAFMVDGVPDASKFEEALRPVLQSITRGREAKVIRAYGEMVDVLWKAGQMAAATRLEMLWNDLASHHRFSLLCGYAMGNLYKDAAVEEICSHHTHVLSASGEAAPLH